MRLLVIPLLAIPLLAVPLLALTLLAPAPVLASGGVSGGAGSAATAPAQSLEELAVESYYRGLRLRDKAWELEERAAGKENPAKLLAKVEKTWTKASSAFRESIDQNPLLHQAHSSLGYTYRKLGRYEESLGSYNRALELAPGYVEAIEYRAEAYLGLNRLDEAKQSYMDLFRVDRDQADALMTAMRGWIERVSSGGAVSEEIVTAFAAWVEERSEIASQTAMLTEAQGRSW